MFRYAISTAVVAVILIGNLHAQPKRTPRQALKDFNHLIGQWKGTGVPNADRNKFWSEKMRWSWGFKKKDAWLEVEFFDNKHFMSGELRYLPDTDGYRFIVDTNDKRKLVYEGQLAKKRLRLTRIDDKTKDKELLTIRLLHSNRFLYSMAVQPKGRTLYRSLWQVGATKKGVPFAAGSGQPECIVSGGLGTSKVTHKGKTYYVCCSGCRTEFYANPEMYIREFEAKQKKQGK